MSSSVFPILPLVQPARASRDTYATKVLTAVSGKRVTAAWRASSIRRINFSVRLRSWKQAPSPWAAYTEPQILEFFFSTVKGSWDTFLLDNSTGLYWRGGPSQPTVRFTADECPIEEEHPGLYLATVELETAL